MALTETHQFVRGHGAILLATRSGRQVRVRHIRPDDAGLLVDLFHRLSPETRRFRFFTAVPDLPDDVLWREARRYTEFNEQKQAAFVALAAEQQQERAIGVVRMVIDKTDAETAEMAIVLRDDYQRDGLGAQLFDLLIQLALVRGVKKIRAVSLAENTGVHRLIHNAGFPVTSHTSHGETIQTVFLDG